ncbi:MAG TPA: hypothetical protein VFT10_06970 [Solirubrobacterales bacterium]|nr:hypothetical protein [Solirubrobacterales bacterium]
MARPESIEAVAPESDTFALDGTAAAQLTAVEEIRTTAKWITAAFAGVGGALITGISLSDLGEQTGAAEMFAVGGATIAIFGVLLVILFATRVLASPFVVLAEFGQVDEPRPAGYWSSLNPAPSQKLQLAWVLARLNENRSLGTYREESIAQFIVLLDRWREEHIWAVREVLAAEKEKAEAAGTLAKAESVGAESQAEIEAAEAAADVLEDAEHKLRRARNEVRVSEQLAARLRAAAQYEYVKQRFDTSRVWIVIGAAAAGIGVLVFVLATSSPK